MSVELQEAAKFLAARFGDDLGEVAPLGQGVWSRAYGFCHDGRDYVARFGAYVDDFLKDQRASQYASAALPIPRVSAVGEALGGYYAIAERVYGGYIDEVDGTQMHALLPALFAALDAARLADLSDTTGYGGWNADGNGAFAGWREFLLAVNTDDPASRGHGWRARLAASAVGIARHDEAYGHLVALADGMPEERHLIHSDLLHFNVLVEGARITGIFDWGCSLYGDFLYDLAWLCYWQPWYPAWRDIDFK